MKRMLLTAIACGTLCGTTYAQLDLGGAISSAANQTVAATQGAAGGASGAAGAAGTGASAGASAGLSGGTSQSGSATQGTGSTGLSTGVSSGLNNSSVSQSAQTQGTGTAGSSGLSSGLNAGANVGLSGGTNQAAAATQGTQAAGRTGLNAGGQLGAQIGSRIGSQVGGQTGSQVGAQAGARLGGQLSGDVGSQLGGQTSSQFGTQAGAQLGTQSASGSTNGNWLNRVGNDLRSALQPGTNGALRLQGNLNSNLQQYGFQAGDQVIGANGQILQANQLDAYLAQNPNQIRVLRNGQTVVIGGNARGYGQGYGSNVVQGGYSQWGSGYGNVQQSSFQSGNRPRLGITMTPSQTAVIVSQVMPGSPAQMAGLRPGDQILAVNGQQVANPNAMIQVVGQSGEQSLDLQYSRNGQIMESQVMLTSSGISQHRSGYGHDQHGTDGGGRGQGDINARIDQLERMLQDLRNEVRQSGAGARGQLNQGASGSASFSTDRASDRNDNRGQDSLGARANSSRDDLGDRSTTDSQDNSDRSQNDNDRPRSSDRPSDPEPSNSDSDRSNQ